MTRYFLIFSVIIVIPTTSFAGLFGPSNFDECIIESMKGVTSDTAALAIATACRRKFPGKAQQKTVEVPEAVVGQLNGNASMSADGFFGGTAYNGNDNWCITQFTILIKPKSNQQEKAIEYNVNVTVQPLTTQYFNILAFPTGYSGQFDWTIVSARGYRVHAN